MTHHLDLSSFTLAKGSHPDTADVCLMELTAIFAGEEKSDRPACTSPVLAAFGIAFNDGVDDEARQRLVPFIPRLVGTSGDRAADEVRAWMATDWLVRTFTPAWLRKCGLVDRAAELEALPALTSTALAKAAQPIIKKARTEASTAGDAAGDAAWAAAGAAAGAAAWAAAGAAAGAAARAAAGAAAGDAAWAAARAAAGDAASGYETKYVAARKAADAAIAEALGETISELREDALRLFSRMIDVRVAVTA